MPDATPGILQHLDPQRWREHRFGLTQARWAGLAGRCFWITGAGTGFGRSMAVALAAAGKRAYEARASCRPGGVPGFLVMGRVNPLYFVQGKNEVLLINEGGPEVRHVFLDVPNPV